MVIPRWQPSALPSTADRWRQLRLTLCSRPPVRNAITVPSTADCHNHAGRPLYRLARPAPEVSGDRADHADESSFGAVQGPAGQRWCEAAREIGVRAVRLDEEWASSVNLDNDGALLVRPDGFIAWRAESRTPPFWTRCSRRSPVVRRRGPPVPDGPRYPQRAAAVSGPASPPWRSG
ncbi:hypothetical protein AB0I53_40500 [Saccharopolyspora sp. NPDC050389]|uniref:aromatic-ring hydroxylase C-terminal domain-containing protein n=1 Tax=Saccharopolyspora sp. NPDC050389 TaxID=3155516 RepID=UPI003406CF17